MAYQAGNKILDDHYNTFVYGTINGSEDVNTANVNSTWGSGALNKGYGQSSVLPSVTPGTKITATQWANLLNRIDTLAAHQGTTVSGISNPAVGDQISAYATLQADIDAVYANRANAIASGSSVTQTFDLTASWTVSSYPKFTISFPTANAMRYFFNAGGLIKVSVARSGGSVTDKNAEWTDLLDKCGTIVFSNGSTTANIAGTSYTGTNKVGGAGTVNYINSNYGFYDMAFDATYVQLFQQYADTTPYTSNRAQLWVRGETDSKSMTLRYSLLDDAPEDSANDTVDGTITMTCTITHPSTTYLSDTWGPITLTGGSDGQT